MGEQVCWALEELSDNRPYMSTQWHTFVGSTTRRVAPVPRAGHVPTEHVISLPYLPEMRICKRCGVVYVPLKDGGG